MWARSPAPTSHSSVSSPTAAAVAAICAGCHERIAPENTPSSRITPSRRLELGPGPVVELLCFAVRRSEDDVLSRLGSDVEHGALDDRGTYELERGRHHVRNRERVDELGV